MLDARITLAALALVALAGCGKPAEKSADATAPAATATASAPAADTGMRPLSKPGVWEVTQSIQGIPVPIKTKMCVDESMGEKMFDTATIAQSSNGMQCTQRDVTRNASGADIHSVCTHDGRTIDSRIHVAFVDENTYQQTVAIHFDPPIKGHADQTLSMEGKWLGPCPADMKGGDVSLPGGVNVNMYDAMKKVAEKKAELAKQH